MPLCVAPPMAGRRWNNGAAASPGRPWPTNACRPTPPRRRAGPRHRQGTAAQRAPQRPRAGGRDTARM